jgi:hypothetical protein
MNPPPGPAESLLDGAPPPDRVVEAAKESYTWRTVDAELAELTNDSLVDQPAVLTRGPSGPRALTFEAADLAIEVEVTVSGRQRRLLGQLVPAQPAQIEVSQAGTTITVEADAAGRFRFPGLEARPVGLCCRLAGRRPVCTEWLLL